MATALESSHSCKRMQNVAQLLRTECVSGQSAAFTRYVLSEIDASHTFLNRDVIRIFAQLVLILLV